VTVSPSLPLPIGRGRAGEASAGEGPTGKERKHILQALGAGVRVYRHEPEPITRKESFGVPHPPRAARADLSRQGEALRERHWR